MAGSIERRTATILNFPVAQRFAERIRNERYAALEREAAETCEAASGAWYHAAAVRDAEGLRGN